MASLSVMVVHAGEQTTIYPKLKAGNTEGGSIIVLLTSCLTGLDWSVLQIKTKIVSSHTADSKPVKQEVNGTVILPPLVFPAQGFESRGHIFSRVWPFYERAMSDLDKSMHRSLRV
jgi:hypothetical protein